MQQGTRREFLRHAVTGMLVCSVAEQFQSLPRAHDSATARYDLLIKNGRVIDPAQKLSAVRDVAITGHKISRVAENITEADARQVLDAKGKLVTPGLIDVHVH